MPIIPSALAPEHRCPFPLVVAGRAVCTCGPSFGRPLFPVDVVAVDGLRRHLGRELLGARQRYHDADDDGERAFWRGGSVALASALDQVDALTDRRASEENSSPAAFAAPTADRAGAQDYAPAEGDEPLPAGQMTLTEGPADG